VKDWSVRFNRNFQGLDVRVDQLGPRLARVTMPDRETVKIVRPTDDHTSLDESICFQVNQWRVDKWHELGSTGAL
jgi:hypothetical protein